MKKKHVKGEGNCMYRCIGVFFHGTEARHGNIRKKVVGNMRNHKENFQEMIDGDFEEHMRNQRMMDGRQVSWATEAEIQAVSEIFRYTIFIRMELNNNKKWLKHSASSSFEHPIKWIAMEHENDHFILMNVV